MIDRFFRPFLSGTFFDPKLGVSSRTFELIMRAFAVGPNCIPANGMQAIADQLAAPLVATDSIFVSTPVATVKPSSGDSPAAVVLANGKTVTASKYATFFSCDVSCLFVMAGVLFSSDR